MPTLSATLVMPIQGYRVTQIYTRVNNRILGRFNVDLLQLPCIGATSHTSSLSCNLTSKKHCPCLMELHKTHTPWCMLRRDLSLIILVIIFLFVTTWGFWCLSTPVGSILSLHSLHTPGHEYDKRCQLKFLLRMACTSLNTGRCI